MGNSGTVRRGVAAVLQRLSGGGPLDTPQGLFQRAARRLLRETDDTGARALVYRELLAFDPWCLDEVRVRDGRVSIRGWILPPGGDWSRIGFTLNGRPFENVDGPFDRDDLGRLYWYLPYARRSGFEGSTALEPGEETRPFVLQAVDRTTGQPLRDEHACYFDPASASADVGQSAAVPLPDGVRMRRVHGSDSAESFLLEGYQAYRKLDLALQRHAGRSLASSQHILDWGCGCGRLLRHLMDLPASVRLTGADIDHDNVNWCRQHLPRGEYVDLALHPPTPLPGATFDVIIGISVMTHLGEADQDDWLKELRRVAAPGGIALLTVHGRSTVARQNWDETSVRAWQARGFVDGGSHDLDAVISDKDYYRNTCHTAEYIREHWGRFFEVVTVIESYIGNVQDLVVLRAR